MSTEGKVRNPLSIQYEIDYDQPIEIGQFTKSLNAFSAEYQKFITENYEGQHPEASLLIEKIEHGSILTTLVEQASNAIPFLGDTNTLLDFGTHLAGLFGWFVMRRNANKKPKFDATDLDNLQALLSPAVPAGNGVKIDIVGDGNVVNVVNADSEEAKAAIQQIAQAKRELENAAQNLHLQQLFYWSQAKADVASQTGNFGVIEAISPNKLKTIFSTDEIKRTMLKGQENPFTKGYVVDVEVQTVANLPKLYRITKLHESFDL